MILHTSYILVLFPLRLATSTTYDPTNEIVFDPLQGHQFFLRQHMAGHEDEDMTAHDVSHMDDGLEAGEQQIIQVESPISICAFHACL